MTKLLKSVSCQSFRFMATENIMMDAVKAGGDRQELHEEDP